MVNHKTRLLTTVCLLAAMLLASPTSASACGWLDCLFGCGRTSYSAPYAAPYVAPAAYAPCASGCAPVATGCAPACAPYTSGACGAGYSPCATQACYYVPQTYYRTVYQPVATTSYLPVASYDPCSGCPVTAYRPVTAWVQQARLVPYTSYRMEYAAAYSPYVTYYAPTATTCNAYTSCSAYGSCGDCGTTSCVAATGGCSSCIAAPAASGATTNGATPSPAESAPSLSTPPAGTTAPYGDPAPGGSVAPPQTFQPESRPAAESRQYQAPATESKTDSSLGAPRLIDPENRTTLREVRPATYFQLIAAPRQSVISQKPALNDGGWQPARD